MALKVHKVEDKPPFTSTSALWQVTGTPIQVERYRFGGLALTWHLRCNPPNPEDWDGPLIAWHNRNRLALHNMCFRTRREALEALEALLFVDPLPK
jgi:hypothetical protein